MAAGDEKSGTRIRVNDSRRLTGPNLLWERAGAVADVTCPEALADSLVAAWRRSIEILLPAVGWDDEASASRRFAGGASLAISAPMDALYAATEVNETALGAAGAEMAGGKAADLDSAAARLRQVIHKEANPALLELQAAAARHGVSFLSDDEQASVGLGRGSLTFPVRDFPSPDSIDWPAVHDIPVALITGTNGKSTTVRLLGAMARAAGRVPGVTSTDGIWVGEALAEGGDYSGPGGARRVLRDQRVEVAMLETARGGMLRRGLGVRRARAALVTNVGQDHLGEFGIVDFDGLVEAKMIVRRAVGEAGCLVLNADDDALWARGAALATPPAWFSMEAERPEIGRLLDGDDDVALLESGDLVLYRQGIRHQVVRAADVPATLGGAARHNIANALGAILVGATLGIGVEAMGDGLRQFAAGPEENPGRGNLLRLGEAQVLVDFAHNPHGLRALFRMAAALPARRRLVLLGQAGDRTDVAICELARITWEARPERIVIKEMRKYLRGRSPGEIPDMIEAELRRLGAGDGAIERAASEWEGVEKALSWVGPGDLLLLLLHTDRNAVLAYLQDLQARSWQPGEPLPARREAGGKAGE